MLRLPAQQMSDAEVLQEIQKAIGEAKPSGIKDMGKVMGCSQVAPCRQGGHGQGIRPSQGQARMTIGA